MESKKRLREEAGRVCKSNLYRDITAEESKQKREEAYQKLERLRKNLREMKHIAVAFSGGVDSAFLLKQAHDLPECRILAVTVHARSFPQRELQEAQEFCRKEGIRQKICEFDELKIPGFCQNPPDRCYLCKKGIFQNILKLAGAHGIVTVAEGSNMDDLGDYRPGMRALEELGIKSPLRNAGLTKQEIRLLSRECGLLVWDKPSSACLSSRFAYGEVITREKLAMVERAEEFLRRMGFVQRRVRVHGGLARIEVLPEDLPRLVQEENRLTIMEKFRQYGFTYVTLDLQGYRTGSMNEALQEKG